MSDKLNIFSLAPVSVELENGRKVHLRRLTGSQRIVWIEGQEKRLEEAGEKGSTLSVMLEDQVKLLSLSLCDDKGSLLFAGEDSELIKKIDARTLDFLTNEALTINALNAEGAEAVKKKSKATTKGS